MTWSVDRSPFTPPTAQYDDGCWGGKTHRIPFILLLLLLTKYFFSLHPVQEACKYASNKQRESWYFKYLLSFLNDSTIACAPKIHLSTLTLYSLYL